MQEIVPQFISLSLQITDPQYAVSANIFLSQLNEHISDYNSFLNEVMMSISTLDPKDANQVFIILLTASEKFFQLKKELVNISLVESVQKTLIDYVVNHFSWELMDKTCQVVGTLYFFLWLNSPASDRATIINQIGTLNSLHPRVCFTVFDTLIDFAIKKKILTISTFLSSIAQYILTTLNSTDKDTIIAAFELLSTILSWPFNSSKKSFSPPEKFNFIISDQFIHFVYDLIKTTENIEQKLVFLDIFNKCISSSFNSMPDNYMDRFISLYVDVYKLDRSSDSKVFYSAASGLKQFILAHGYDKVLKSPSFPSLLNEMGNLCFFSFSIQDQSMEFELFSVLVESLSGLAKYFINFCDHSQIQLFGPFVRLCTDIFGGYVHARLALAVSDLVNYDEISDEVEDDSSMKSLLQNVAVLGRLYPEDTIIMLTNLFDKFSSLIHANSEDEEALEQLVWVATFLSHLLADFNEDSTLSQVKFISPRLSLRDLTFHLVNSLFTMLQFCVGKSNLNGSGFSPLVVGSVLQLCAVVTKCCSVDHQKIHSFLELSLILLGCPEFASHDVVASAFVSLISSAPHLVTFQMFSMLYENPALIYNLEAEKSGIYSKPILESLANVNTQFLEHAALCITKNANVNFNMCLQLYSSCLDAESMCLDAFQGSAPSFYLPGIVNIFCQKMPLLASITDLVLYNKFFSRYIAGSTSFLNPQIFKAIFENSWKMYKSLTYNKAYTALDDTETELLAELFISSFCALSEAVAYDQQFRAAELEYLIEQLTVYNQVIRTPSVLNSAMECISICLTFSMQIQSIQIVYALLNDQLDTGVFSKTTAEAIIRFIDLQIDSISDMKIFLCQKLMSNIIEMPKDSKTRSDLLCKLSNFVLANKSSFSQIISELISVPQTAILEYFSANSTVEIKSQLESFNAKI